MGSEDKGPLHKTKHGPVSTRNLDNDLEINLEMNLEMRRDQNFILDKLQIYVMWDVLKASEFVCLFVCLFVLYRK